MANWSLANVIYLAVHDHHNDGSPHLNALESWAMVLYFQNLKQTERKIVNDNKFQKLTFSADEMLTRGGPETIVSCENARLATKFVVLGTRVLAT